MEFFKRFFKKVETVNKGETAISELDSEFYLASSAEDANNFWIETAQNIIVNAVKATNNTVERANPFPGYHSRSRPYMRPFTNCNCSRPM